MSKASPSFICPGCGAPLTRHDEALRCEQGHSFDVSVDGYVNLMPSGRLAGGVAGDSANMIRARRELFDGGHYSPVMTGVAEMVRRALPDTGFAETADPVVRNSNFLNTNQRYTPFFARIGARLEF